ncbi:MAG: rod shape-determining protein MreD [Thermoleophilia bacterium]
MRSAGAKAESEVLAWPAPADIVRLVVALLAAVLLQTTIAPNIRILGANPDFALILVVCVALLRGAEIGAVFGFLTGSLVAIALMEPFGLGAFIFVLVGYFVGRYAETADLAAGFAPLVSAFAATLIASVLYALAQGLLARQVPLDFFIVRVLLPALVLNTLLAGPLYLVVRFWLREGGALSVAQRPR